MGDILSAVIFPPYRVPSRLLTRIGRCRRSVTDPEQAAARCQPAVRRSRIRSGDSHIRERVLSTRCRWSGRRQSTGRYAEFRSHRRSDTQTSDPTQLSAINSEGTGGADVQAIATVLRASACCAFATSNKKFKCATIEYVREYTGPQSCQYFPCKSTNYAFHFGPLLGTIKIDSD